MNVLESLSKPLPLAGLYVAVAALYYAGLFWRQSRGKKASNIEESFSMVFVPVALVGLALMSLIATPYFWLYPERHMHVADMDGTEEERLRLKRYRDYRKRVGVAGRIAELCGWRPFDKPTDTFLDGSDRKD